MLVTDHAAVIRKALTTDLTTQLMGPGVVAAEALAALDALVTERDKWRQAYEDCHWCETQQAELTEIAEAERDRYKAALEQIRDQRGNDNAMAINAYVIARDVLRATGDSERDTDA